MTALVGHWTVLVLLCLASVMTLAMARDGRRRHEPAALIYGRTIAMGGWWLLTARWGWLLLRGGFLPVPAITLVAVALIAAGVVLICLVRVEE